MIFRKPAKLLVLPLTKPINDGSDDPRVMKAPPVWSDNTMPTRDWSAYDRPTCKRVRRKKRFAPPVLCVRQAS